MKPIQTEEAVESYNAAPQTPQGEVASNEASVTNEGKVDSL